MAVVRDTQWLMLEACREFQRGTCKRTDTECKYAHPSKSVTVENGRVTACFDSLKGRCTRENCKYLHPPPHLKTQLEINGRNNLAAQKMLQNIQSQQLMHTAAAAAAMQQSLPGVLPSQSLPSMAQPVPSVSQANHQASQDAVYLYPSMQLPLTPSPVPNSLPGYPYLTQAPGGTTNPNIMQEMNLQGQMLPTPGTALPIIPTAKNKNDKLEANPYTAWVHQQFMKSAGHQDYSGLSTQPAVMQGHTHQLNSQLQVCREFQRGNCSRGEQECKFAHPNEQTTIDNTDNTVTVCMDYIKGRCTREKCKYFHPPPHLQAKIKAAQHQANQASVVPAVLPTTTPENSLKRQRDPADDILLQFPGFVPPTKKHPSMAGSQHNTILNHHHHHPSVGINHYLQMQLSNAGQPPSYIPAPGINQYLQQLSNAVGQPPSYIPAPGINQYLQQLSNAAGQPSPYAPGVERTILGGLPASYAWQQGKLGNSFLCQGDIMSHPALAIPMMQPMAGTPASVPLYTHQYVQSQSADTIPVCRDFKSGSCKRPNCKYAHVTEDYVEIIDGKVTLCRYAAQSRCTRPKCKFYHPPAASLPLMTTVPIGSIPTTPVVTSV